MPGLQPARQRCAVRRSGTQCSASKGPFRNDHLFEMIMSDLEAGRRRALRRAGNSPILPCRNGGRPRRWNPVRAMLIFTALAFSAASPAAAEAIQQKEIQLIN